MSVESALKPFAVSLNNAVLSEFRLHIERIHRIVRKYYRKLVVNQPCLITL
jgi:hypothetical protein